MERVPTLRNTWWMAMWSQDLASGQLLARRILNEPLVFYRAQDGTPTALHDRCPHRWAPLSKGKLVDGDRLQCPYHGLEFGQDGVCVRNPHPNYQIPSLMRTQHYALAEKHSAIWIWMGTSPPDESLIPDFGWLDPGANPIDRRNYLLMPCAWDLMVDNLLDTSHIAILHDGNLGNPEMIDADTIVEERGPRSIAVRREFRDIPASMFYGLLSFNRWPRIDVLGRMTWVAPAGLTNFGMARPSGAAESEGTGIQTCYFLTPETDSSCHYHFAAMRIQAIRGTPQEEAEIMRGMADVRQQAFVEQDGFIIAAQQARIIDAQASNEALLATQISADVGVERAHKILRQLYEDEQRQPVGA